jgi:hypothetical protein
MCLEDPLAVPGPKSRLAAASPGHRPVSARSWAGRWLPASRSPSSDRTQRSGPAAVSGAAPLVSKMHSHVRTCSWWAIVTARITVRAASHSHRPAQAIRSRAPARNARSARAPVGRPMCGSGGSGESGWALGLPMRIRFITDLPWVINRARPGILLLIRRLLRIRQGKCWAPRGILVVIKSFATRVCAGQGSDDPFSHGRSRPAGTLRLPLVLLWPWPGVITTHAAHRRPTGLRRLIALACGVERSRGRWPNRAGRLSQGAGPEGCGRSGGCAPGSGLAGCREYWCRRLAWVILVQALAAPCLVPRGG